MPDMTFPNQRMIKINRERAKSDFLGIKNENWLAASRDLGAHGLQLYLYLASNANGYTLALSPATIQRDLGMARSTYHDQFHKLVNRGYLLLSHGSTYNFFETSQSVTQSQKSISSNGLAIENCTSDGQPLPQDGNIVLPENIEINNTDISTNMAINKGLSPEEKGDSGIYIPKVVEIRIPVPEVHTKERDRLTALGKTLQKGDKFTF